VGTLYTYSGNGKLDINALENWLWDAACKIRGEVDAPKYKEYILPLIFLKRLSDVYDDELDKLKEDFGSKEEAEKLVAEDHTTPLFGSIFQGMHVGLASLTRPLE